MQSRRDFVLGTSGLGAALAIHLTGPSLARPLLRSELFRISLAQWSLHRELQSGTLDNLDFAARASSYGAEGVEYVNSFFKERAADFDYLALMREHAADAGVQSLLIMIDGEGTLGASDDSERRSAVENHFKWIAAARFLGCHSIRVNAGGSGDWDEQMRLAADSLRRLAIFGDDYGIDVIVENHGGLSSNGKWLAATIEMADHERVGTLPDFGNFHLGEGEWYDRYDGVRELMPFAKAVSAKSHAFDASGNETETDYGRMLKIVLDAGYRGWIGIEYEGGELSEVDGIARTRQLLERLRTELASEYRD
ncbi:MAG: L-ribulose-5-phosphate 3-epimerase [Chlamydiales bacterium]|jgi:L-ribulose-5-phosphate 3-epimerase